MDSIRTSDLYEAAYYLSEGFPPESISCRRLNATILCDFHFSRSGLDERQQAFLTNKAHVNLLLFRRSYGEIHSYAANAKRDYKKALKEESQKAGVS